MSSKTIYVSPRLVVTYFDPAMVEIKVRSAQDNWHFINFEHAEFMRMVDAVHLRESVEAVIEEQALD